MTRAGRTSGESRVVAVLCKMAVGAGLLSALYFLGAFLYVAISRIGYPFALEWLEGESYVHVHRLLTGQPLCARPSVEYVAMIYPPLYYYVSAFSARFMEHGFLPLRLVSLLSTLGCFGLIHAIIRHQTRSALSALVGVVLLNPAGWPIAD